MCLDGDLRQFLVIFWWGSTARFTLYECFARFTVGLELNYGSWTRWLQMGRDEKVSRSACEAKRAWSACKGRAKHALEAFEVRTRSAPRP